jgi:hypothetical protein
VLCLRLLVKRLSRHKAVTSLRSVTVYSTMRID